MAMIAQPIASFVRLPGSRPRRACHDHKAISGAALILTLKPRLTRMLEPRRDHSPG